MSRRLHLCLARMGGHELQYVQEAFLLWIMSVGGGL